MSSIKAYDTACIEKGALFEIPVTVVQPIVLTVDNQQKHILENTADFKPNIILRSFVLVPPTATWAGEFFSNLSKHHLFQL